MKKQLCDDLGVFLAHSATLERESAERFYELAAMMKVHNNDQLHELFLTLARFSVEHVNEVEAICREHQLPELKPWDYHWPGEEAPESIDIEQLHYLMSPREALQLVYKVELGAEAFYRSVALESGNETIRDYAQNFAAEEHEHAEAAKSMLAKIPPQEPADRGLDLDPPVMPE